MTGHLDGARLDALWDFADPAGSARRLQEESAEEPARSELDTQVARALGLQGDFAGGDAVLDAIDSTDAVVTIRVALERGRLLNSSGRPADAVPYFSAALETAVEHGEDFLAVDAAHMLGIAQPERSAEWTERGIRIVDSSTDDRAKRWAIALHNNRGWALHDDGHFDEALAEFELADAAAKAHGTQEQQHVAQWAIARCLRSLGRIPEALAIQEQLFAADPTDEYVVEELAALRG
jgi:tetratricopeptide (TPR) repeat protein